MANRVKVEALENPKIIGGIDEDCSIPKKKAKRKGNPAFVKGMKSLNPNGRPKGSKNKLTMELKQAIMTAMAMVGSDRKGKDGAEGYLAALAANHPEIFAKLLEKMIPFVMQAPDGPISIEYRSKHEVITRMRERGLPVPASLLLEANHSGSSTQQ